MASPMPRHNVLVTLTAVHPPSSLSFPSRRIFLSKTKPTLCVGRTSKRNVTFEASANNAWIDSAVMSRDHAVIRFDPHDQKVLIRDIGSLHGTFHNNARLGQNEVRALKNGDLIRFGIAIDRGCETFPPCTMRTSIEFGLTSPEERPTVFRVPDESDVEELNSDTEDVSVQHTSQILRNNQIHPAGGQATSKISFVAIDLTSSDLDTDCLSPQVVDDEASPRILNEEADTHLAYTSSSPSMAELMGTETGKFEYFAAREHNKLNAQSFAPMPVEELSSLGPPASTEEPLGGQVVISSGCNEEMEPVREFGSGTASEAPEQDACKTAQAEEVAQDLPTQPSPLLESGSEFLNSPPQEHYEPLASGSPDIDDQSAYQFEITKRMLDQQQPQAQTHQMETDDLALSNSGSPQGPQVKALCNKRKASEISEATPDEELTELNAAAISLLLGREPKAAERTAWAKYSTLNRRNDSSLDYNDGRPAKRLRKVAEIFGYAALGGVAVMSALIATAPAL